MPVKSKDLLDLVMPHHRKTDTINKTQITNNIKITNHNDQTISIPYLMSRRDFICFEF